MLKAPQFWYKNVGLKAFLCSPLGAIYGLFSRLPSLFSKPYRASVPVISVGNIVMGGAGKTPTTIALAELLASKGFSPAIVIRGYGGKLTGPVKVSAEEHAFSDVGDEALLLCRVAPTYVAKKRDLGVKLAEQEGADIILLDDGHQNAQVHKDISLVVVGGEQKFGNGKVFPAGPLRESLSRGFKRADAIVYVGRDPFSYEDLPIFRAQIRPKPFPYAGKRVVGFCGLGFPQKFKETLLYLGCHLDKFIIFPDHYPYTEEDIQGVVKHSYGLPIVTTEKDFIRVPKSFDQVMHVIEILLTFEDSEGLLEFVT